MDKRSIGVFDSGVGGLTVVKELRKQMPNEDITYFGDIARVPYGGKSPETILRYSREDINFLLSRDVKAIVVACGTASSVLTTEIIREYDLPIFTVIKPSCEDAVKKSKTGKIAVIGTAATVKSRAHLNEIKQLTQTAEVYERPCPLFVPIVENGYLDPENVVIKQIVTDYLAPVRAANPDTLILGCTHYPLLSEAIGNFMGPEVTLVNMGVRLAEEVKSSLEEQGLANSEKRHGNVRYYVSDDTMQFAALASIFLEESIRGFVEQVEIQESSGGKKNG